MFPEGAEPQCRRWSRRSQWSQGLIRCRMATDFYFGTSSPHVAPPLILKLVADQQLVDIEHTEQ